MGEDPGAVRRRAGTALAVVVAVAAVVLGMVVLPALERQQAERRREQEVEELANDPEKRAAKHRAEVEQQLRAIERRGAVLVTAQEKEEIGYEYQAKLISARLQRQAMENQEQIYSVVQPAVEAQIGRKVELTDISASYPYRSVSVGYRTVDEPVVAFSALVDLERDGTVRSASQVSTSGIVLDGETVRGLYLMAYREELDRMREYLATTYPHFAPLPQGYMRWWSHADPMFRFRYWGSGPDKFPQIKAATSTIYEAYLEQPERSDAEWRELFESVDPGFGMTVTVNVMVQDPAVELTEAMARELADDLVANPLFAGTTAWIINASSNQLVRDGVHFHDRWMFRIDPDMNDPHPDLPGPRWRVERIVQGSNVERFADGDER